MGYKPPLDEGELHSQNRKSILEWIERNKGKIKAKSNKTILYSGRDYDLDMKELERTGEYKGTPMHVRIEQFKKRLRDMKIPCEWQTIGDVLKDLKDYPEVVDKDRQVQQYFSDAEDFFNLLGKSKRLDPLLPNAGKLRKDCWGRLSEIFAGNAVGDIKIYDGAADDYSKLKVDKDFIDKELAALLKNDKLSPKSKALLKAKISKFGSYFDRRYTHAFSRTVAEDEATRGELQDATGAVPYLNDQSARSQAGAVHAAGLPYKAAMTLSASSRAARRTADVALELR